MRRSRLKPGKPLTSKTQLQRKSPMARTGFSGGARPVTSPGRAPSTLARKPLKAVSAQRRNDAPARRAAEAVLFALRPWCWFDGEMGVELHGHELRSRGQGGLATEPDALLCNRHNTWCEDNPTDAVWLGWKISRKPHPIMPCIASGACCPWDHSAADCYLRGAA
jgi:hypothetical protein